LDLGRYTNGLRPIRVHLLLLVLGAMLPGALLMGILAWRAFANDAPLGPATIAVLTASVVLMVGCLAAALAMARRLSVDLAVATAAAETLVDGGPIAPANAQVAEIHHLQRSLASAASLLEVRARARDNEIKRADTARREAEQANETKDQFLAVLGHELRNPLSPALTALELMKARDPGAFKREREVLERQVAHMARLVSDLLDVSSLARGKVQLHLGRFEIREAVDRAVDMARPLISQKQHTLNILVPTSGLQVDGDIDRIVQVLSNLLTNAAKYTPPRGHVVLTARSSADRLVVTCEDDGPGIAADLVPKLFDPFAQGPRALDRRGSGLGLGLALARSLTEAHGGTIHVQGRAGKAGSCFVVTLPLVPTDVAGDDASSAPAAGRAEAKRVLVVDDNMDACEMLRAALEHAGHLVAIAGTGPDAIAIASDFVPDVAVLDLGLPGMNGYELASHLRRSRPPIRLIAVTGYGRAGDVEAAAAAGFDAHYAKPVAITSLLAHIETDVGQDFSPASLEPT
jgi:signal transduction histidine kinase/CheY-like chemotaxis protein